MTPQSSTTRAKISFILEQVGMSDEELYQLLYGRKQAVEIDISLPQLMDEEIWQATEHSVEELGAIENKIGTVEMLLDSSLDAGAIAQMEELLEGEIEPDDVRGLLLKKRFPNWRKGMAQFLNFLQFSALMKLAIAIGALTANHLIPRFENAKNRPQDRKFLSDFILAQLEQPLPPMIAALAAVGATLTHTGALEFMQPMTAAIIGLDGQKLTKIKHILEERVEKPEFMDGVADDPHYKDKYHNPQQNQKTSAQMGKLYLLDRIGDMVANQQQIQPQPQEQNQSQPEQTQQQPRQRRSSTRRAMREMQERNEREAQEKINTIETTDQHHPTGHQPRSFQRMVSSNRQQQPAVNTQNVMNRQPVIIENDIKPAANNRPTPTKEKRDIPKLPSAPTSAPSEQAIIQPKKVISHHDHPPQVNKPIQDIEKMMAGLPLDALKGIKFEHVDNHNIGKAKASIAKDNPITNQQTKPAPQQER